MTPKQPESDIQSNKTLTKQERAALAMHELMKREQERYRQRVAEQNKISLLTDEKLKEIVYGK